MRSCPHVVFIMVHRNAGRAPVRARMTAEEFFQSAPSDCPSELIRGRMVVREPAKPWHGVVASRAQFAIARFVHPATLGEVVAAETGFVLARDPDTVRAPDAAFITAAKRHMLRPDFRGDFVPDLVVEVRSPSESRRAVRAKALHWISSGVRLVWTIDPMRHEGCVYRSDGTQRALTAAEAFEGEDVIPGFVMPLRPLIDY
jgi:Uma2 family endonuclease